MTLPTDYIDGDVLTAEDINDITTAVNALDLDVIRIVAFNEQTGSYTLVLADGFKAIEMNVATANNVTVPTNSSVAFPIGTQIIVLQIGAGVTTLVASGGVTLQTKDSNVELGGQFAGVTLIKRDTNVWIAVGDLA